MNSVKNRDRGLRLGNLLSKPGLIYFIWSLLVLFPIFLFIRLKLLIASSIEIPGFIYFKYFIKSLPVILVIAIVVEVIYWGNYLRKNKLIPKQQNAFKFVMITGVIILVLGRVLVFIGQINYANFLYTYTGIDALTIDKISILCGVIVVLLIPIVEFGRKNETLFNKIVAKSFGKIYVKNVSTKLIFYGLLFYLLSSVFNITNGVSYWSNTKATFKDKYGAQFKYIDAIGNLTSSGSAIIHPPRSNKWPAVGNQQVLRYFLYPRLLIDGKIIENDVITKSINEALFAEIDPELPDTHWPKVDSKSKLISFDEKTFVTYKKLEEFRIENDIRIYRIVF